MDAKIIILNSYVDIFIFMYHYTYITICTYHIQLDVIIYRLLIHWTSYYFFCPGQMQKFGIGI